MGADWTRIAGRFLVIGGCCAWAGCGPARLPYPQSLNSPLPQERAAAARYAAEIGDQQAVGLLVDRLDDPDEGVRFYAILALEKLTGTRMGYNYAAPDHQRWRALQAWRRYLAGGAADVPGPTGGDGP